MHEVIDARALSKLKWRCRRGLLENDLFIERFFARHESSLSPDLAEGLRALMDLSDNDLLDLMLARTEPTGELNRPDVRDVLALLRTPPPDRSHFRDFAHSKERA
jgi:antitoxin CptB